MFEVGDRVRIADDTHSPYFAGRSGVISEVDDSTIPYRVTFGFVTDEWFRENEVLPDTGPSPFEGAVTRAFEDAKALLLERHAKYGPKNISASPYGWKAGLITRLWDKLARLRNMEGDATDESRTDAWLDIVGYGLIGLLNERGEWPSA